MKEIWTNAFAHSVGSFEYMTVVYALLAAILLLVVMRKTGLMRREAKWRQALVCLYYLYIPVVFAAGGFAWATVGSMESTMVAGINEARPAISRASAEYAGSAWLTIIKKFRKDSSISMRDLCLSVAREYAAELLEGFSGMSRFTMLMRPLVNGIREGVVLSLASMFENEILSESAAVAKLDKDALRALWTKDLVTALQGGIVADLLVAQVKTAVKPMYRYTRLTFILLLLPVVLETAFAVYRRRRPGPA